MEEEDNGLLFDGSSIGHIVFFWEPKESFNSKESSEAFPIIFGIVWTFSLSGVAPANQTKKEGQNERFMIFCPFLVNSGVFP